MTQRHTKNTWMGYAIEAAYASGYTGAAYAETVADAVGSLSSLSMPMGVQSMPDTYTQFEAIKPIGESKGTVFNFAIGKNYLDGKFEFYLQDLTLAKLIRGVGSAAYDDGTGKLQNSFTLHWFDGNEDYETFGLIIKRLSFEFAPNEFLKQSIDTLHYSTKNTGLTIEDDATGVNFLTTQPKTFADLDISIFTGQLIEDPTFDEYVAAAADGKAGWLCNTANDNWSISGNKATCSAGNVDCLQQVITTTAQDYIIIIGISGRTAGTLTPSIEGVDGTARSADGVYEETITSGSGAVHGVKLTPDATFDGSVEFCYVFPSGSEHDLDIQSVSGWIEVEHKEGFEAGKNNRKFPYIISNDAELTIVFNSDNSTLFTAQYETDLTPDAGTEWGCMIEIANVWALSFNGMKIVDSDRREIPEFGMYEYTFTFKPKCDEFRFGVDDT